MGRGRKVLLGIIGLIVVLVVIGVATGSGKKKTAVAGAPPTTSPVAAASPAVTTSQTTTAPVTVATVPPTTTAPTTVPPTSTSTTAPPGVTFKATGTGATANSVTILVGGNEQQHQGVALPYTLTVPNTAYDYGITVQEGSGSPTASISCEIDEPGQPPVTNTSTGAYAVVDCTGALSF